MFLGCRNNILLTHPLLLHAVSLGETPDFYGPKPVRHQPDAQTGTASKLHQTYQQDSISGTVDQL